MTHTTRTRGRPRKPAPRRLVGVDAVTYAKLEAIALQRGWEHGGGVGPGVGSGGNGAGVDSSTVRTRNA